MLDRLGELCPQARELTANVWAKWMDRAKQRARSQMGEPLWEKLFAEWLPDRQRSPA
jgi:hypothetical protein